MHHRLVCSLAVVASLMAAREARAQLVLSARPVTPTEARVAVAVTPSRTTVWTSLRFTAPGGGSVAIAIPYPDESFVDTVSDAWFEALDASTASPGALATFAHVTSPTVDESVVLEDLAALKAWGAERGLFVDHAADVALDRTTATRFVALRFEAGPGGTLSPTVRVVTPAEPIPRAPSLELTALADAGVQAWSLGESPIDPSNLIGRVLKISRREQLSGQAEALAPALFERAAAYQDERVDLAACEARAERALGQDGRLEVTCPEGSIAAGPCSGDAPDEGEVAASSLGCGSHDDDLAVGLSGAHLARVWIARYAIGGASNRHHPSRLLVGAHPRPLPPVAATGSFPRTGDEGAPSTIGGSSPSRTTSTGDGAGGASQAATPPPGSTAGDWGEGVGAALADTAGACSSSPGASSCSGDSSGSSCSGDSSGSSCDGDSSSSCSGDSGGSCSGDSGGSCSSGGDTGSCDCSIGTRRAPRVTPTLMFLLALLAPLRRRGTTEARRRRRGGGWSSGARCSP